MSLISGEQLLRVQLGAWVSCFYIPIKLTTCVSRFKCCILLCLLTTIDPGCQQNVYSLSGTLSRLRFILQVVPILMHLFAHLVFMAGLWSHLPANARRGTAVWLRLWGPIHSSALGYNHQLQTRTPHAHQEKGGQGLWWVSGHSWWWCWGKRSTDHLRTILNIKVVLLIVHLTSLLQVPEVPS